MTIKSDEKNNFFTFTLLQERYKNDDRTCLFTQSKLYNNSVKGSVLVAIPLFKNTLSIIESLVQIGLDVTVSTLDDLPYDSQCIDILKDAGIPCIPVSALKADYDVVLDCAARVSEKIVAKKFIIELTRTGVLSFENHLKSIASNRPVYSVDDNPIKQIEDRLGIADGLVRGLKATGKDLSRLHSTLVIGGGKVGKGAILGALRFSRTVSVIDSNLDTLKEIKTIFSDRVHTISYQDYLEDKNLLQSSDLVITATAARDIVTKMYRKDLFQGKILVNLGADDEWGPDYTAEEIENKKRPINFLLDEPTQLMYLDPTFALIVQSVVQGLSAERSKSLSNGIQTIPSKISNPIIEHWLKVHRNTLNEDEILYIESLIA